MKIAKLYIVGEINEESYEAFSRELDEAVRKGALSIQVEISSEGGYGYDGLAFYGKIRSCPVPVHGVAHGKIQSAATLVFAACDTRAASEEVWFMVHDSADKSKGNVGTIQSKAEQMEREELQWAEILSGRTKTDSIVWREMSRKTIYFTTERAQKLGLVTKTLKGKK